jgi:hypothetical protein
LSTVFRVTMWGLKVKDRQNQKNSLELMRTPLLLSSARKKLPLASHAAVLLALDRRTRSKAASVQAWFLNFPSKNAAIMPHSDPYERFNPARNQPLCFTRGLDERLNFVRYMRERKKICPWLLKFIHSRLRDVLMLGRYYQVHEERQISRANIVSHN